MINLQRYCLRTIQKVCDLVNLALSLTYRGTARTIEKVYDLVNLALSLIYRDTIYDVTR